MRHLSIASPPLAVTELAQGARQNRAEEPFTMDLPPTLVIAAGIKLSDQRVPERVGIDEFDREAIL